MTIAYIAHPISKDVEGNLAKIRAIVREINLNEPGIVPFVPYYADVVSLDDAVPAERARGMQNDEAVLRSGMVDLLLVYGDRLSEGVKAEISIALDQRIPIRPTDELYDDVAEYCMIATNNRIAGTWNAKSPGFTPGRSDSLLASPKR